VFLWGPINILGTEVFEGQQEEDEFVDALCRPDGDGSLCGGSDHGQCDCGRCVCKPISAAEPNKLYTGNWCECNDYACPYYNGQLCGGMYGTKQDRTEMCTCAGDFL